MNSTFKVVFNKARGALMVVNEVTSSVQAKGTKTVVAAAVATMIAGVAGTAMAEEVAEPAAKITITVNDTNRSDIQKKDVFDGYTSGSDQYKSGAIYITDGKTTTFKDGVKFTNNTSEMSGGAIEVQAGTVTLKDAVITGNKADSWGGAIRMAGNSTVNLTVTKDTVYSGNKANANGKLDYPDMGDFVYMNGATNGQKTTLNLKAEGDATLTVADSIASAGSNNEITTEGKVNVTGSMEAYTGDITVKDGSEFTLAGGFGSYDLWTDSNDRAYNSLSTSTLTVDNGGKASLGDLKITRAAIAGYDADKKKPTGELVNGTILDVAAGGELSINSITVTSQKYSDKFTSYGKGQLTNNGTATVKEHITVEAGGKFDMTGNVTVGRINTAAAVDLDGTDKDLDAGVITHTNGTLTLNNGKSVNNGKVVLDKVVLDKGAVLETSVVTDKFTVNELTLNEGTKLNVTEFNSNHYLGLGNKKEEGKEYAKDQWLVTKNVVLNGGTLAYKNGTLDNIKVGMNSDVSAQLVVNADYSFKNVTISKSGTVNVNADGSITTETLHLSKGNVNVNGGSLTVTGDKGFTVFKGTENKAPALTLTNGTFTVDAGSLFKEQAAAETAADAKKTYVATDAAKVIKGTGTVNVTSKAFEYSLDELREGQKLLNTEGSSAIKLVLANGTLKLGEDEELNATNVDGLNLAGHTGVAGEHANNAFKVTQTTTVGAIDFKAVTDKKATEIALGNSAALTLAGNGGDVFKNLGAKVTKITTGDLVLGTAVNSGNVNVDTLKTDALTVAGDFSARAVEVTSAQIDGMLTADSLAVANNGKAVVAGTLALTGNVKETASELSGNVELDEGSVLTTNVAAAKAIAGEFDESTAIIYVDRQLKLNGATIGAKTVVQNRALLTAAAPARAESTVTVADGMALVIDAGAFTQSAGHDFTKADVSALGNNTTVNLTGGDLELVNVNKLGELDIGKNLVGGTASNVDTDSIYVNAKLDTSKTDIVTLAYNKGLVADATVDARLEKAFTNGVGTKELGILSALDTPAFFDETANKFTAAGNKALEQATGGNATAGVLNVAYDANAQVTDAIVRHQLSEHAGMGVWADVFYAKNEAKEIYGDFGYSADIYGGVLGFDYTAACGGTLGAALTVGTADADSEGGALSNSLSSDFVGLSVYASKDFSGLNVKADLGYIDFSNDFTGLGDASDATTITFGVRGDFTAYQNGAFSVVPHMGLRYTRIDTDAVAFNDEQNMNVLEAPIGVKFAGTFEATGWKLVPSYDFTIVPQLGDKEVEAFGTAGDITILSGGLFNNVLGVEAVKDNMSFGLNASYGFGPDDRANTQINANFRYNF